MIVGRRRRVGQVAAGVLAVVCIAAGVFLVRASTPAVAPGAGTDFTPISSYLASHPPASGRPVVIDTWPPPWTTAGWITDDGQFCRAAFRVPASGTFPLEQCIGIQGDLNSDGNAGSTFGLPIFFAGPMEQQQTYRRADHEPDLSPAVGLVRGSVDRIDLTIFGRTVSAHVTPVGTDGTSQIGAYQVWFETAPTGGYGTTDIQGLTAYDAAGRVVATHGPWLMQPKLQQ